MVSCIENQNQCCATQIDGYYNCDSFNCAASCTGGGGG
jgi:hypothetical protein